MKTVTVRVMQKKIEECVNDSQKDRVIITRHGHPAAVMIGVEGLDWENVLLETDPSFWKLIHKRRNQPTLSLENFKNRFLPPDPFKHSRGSLKGISTKVLLTERRKERERENRIV